MDRTVVFTAEADHDVLESYSWYEERERGLGEEFLRAVEACLSGIQRYPAMYPVVADEFRRAPLRRFPFEIFYEAQGENIFVHSVFHCAQDPEKWRKRLRRT